MRSTRCLFNAATALRRVFITPAKHLQRQSAAQTPNSLQSTRITPLTQRRCVNTGPSDKRRALRDDQIKSWSVYLVGEDGKISEPMSKTDILERIDRDRQTLVVVAEGGPGVPPTCKVMDKAKLRETEKAKAKAERKSTVTGKTLELNWAIDGNDLQHRLNKMKEFLQKGFKVEVLLAPKRKKGSRKATEEDAAALLKMLKTTVAEVDGAKESKPVEGKLLAQMKFFAEGKVQKKTALEGGS